MNPYEDLMDENGTLTFKGESVVMQGLAVLAEASWRNAEDKGFHDSDRAYPEEVALFHSEASESFESYRKGEPAIWFRDKDGNATMDTFGEDEVPNKTEGMAAELADLLIRIGDVARCHTWDLGFALITKARYNRTRPHMHGKVC